MSRKLDLSRKVWFPATYFQHKVIRQSSVQVSLITQKFSASFFKIIKQKNRSEAFSVSSENILHLTFCGFVSGGTIEPETLPINTVFLFVPSAFKHSLTCHLHKTAVVCSLFFYVTLVKYNSFSYFWQNCFNMSVKNTVNEIQDVVNSCSVTTNGVVITVSNPDAFLFSWRLDNKENIGSSYYTKVNNTEEAEKIINHFFPNQTDIIDNLKNINKFSTDEDLFLHLYLKI